MAIKCITTTPRAIKNNLKYQIYRVIIIYYFYDLPSTVLLNVNSGNSTSVLFIFNYKKKKLNYHLF